jgi:hypothetical protein
MDSARGGGYRSPMSIDELHPDAIAHLKRLGIIRDGHIDRHELDRLVLTNPPAGASTLELEAMLACLGTHANDFYPRPSRRVILAELERRAAAPIR